MTSTTDERALAYINMYAILGGLTALCDIATEAGAILGRASCSIGFAVKDGPHATLNFVGGRCRLTDGTDESDILLRFPSCDKFNKMIKGEYTPVPVRGLTKVSFLLGKFKKLTDLLESREDNCTAPAISEDAADAVSETEEAKQLVETEAEVGAIPEYVGEEAEAEADEAVEAEEADETEEASEEETEKENDLADEEE